MNNSKNIIKNVLKLSFSIFINKPIGLFRDILRIKYFGVNLISDAFSMAWRIPNTFRRIFGEGALAAVLTPMLIHIKETEDKKEFNSFITLLIISMQLIVLIFCIIVSIKSFDIIKLIAPGALERAYIAAPMLSIMSFFTLFMSMSVILSSVLQINNYFSMGPLSQFILNVALCLEFFVCIKKNIFYTYIPWLFLFNGAMILGLCLNAYLKMNFSFGMPTKKSYIFLKKFYKNFIPVFAGACIMELSPIIDQGILSYLEVGAQSMIDYISGFVRIPLQVFGSSFATIMAPNFAKLVIKNKNRLNFYIFEIAKLMLFLSFYSIIYFILFSYKALFTLLLSKNFTIEYVILGTKLLYVFSFMFFFSILNKTICNIFYAYTKGMTVTFILLITSFFGTFLNLYFIDKFGIYTIAISSVIIEFLRTSIFIYFLKKLFNLSFYYKKLFIFLFKLIKQAIWMLFFGLIIYFGIEYLLLKSGLIKLEYLNTMFYWIINGPTILLSLFLIYRSRSKFKIKLHYLK